MTIEDLPASKRREIQIGEAFIDSYNAEINTRYRLDERYWDRESDPSPDLRFIQEGRPSELKCEVVRLGDDGETGFRRAAFHSRLMREAQRQIDLAAHRGFEVCVQPRAGQESLGGEPLRALVFKTFEYSRGKAPNLRGGRLRIDVRVDALYYGTMSECYDLVSIVALNEADRARLAIMGHASMLEVGKSIQEALSKKRTRRYGDDVHLLIDNQSIFVQPNDALEMVRAEPLSMPGYAGVWLVTLGNETTVTDLVYPRP